jgi:hypothetical protein
MEDEHLSEEMMWKFARGMTLLLPDELRHFQSCEQCSDACWRLNRNARGANFDDPTVKKSA